MLALSVTATLPPVSAMAPPVSPGLTPWALTWPVTLSCPVAPASAVIVPVCAMTVLATMVPPMLMTPVTMSSTLLAESWMTPPSAWSWPVLLTLAPLTLLVTSKESRPSP